MTFYKAVRNDEVPGPLRREFRPENWTAQHNQLGTGETDKCLHDVGLLLHEKADHIRSNLKITFSKKLSSTTKLRAFVALANYNHWALRNKIKEAMSEAVIAGQGDSEDILLIHKLMAMKVKLQIGADYSPDEIVQSIVDGTQIPIKVILATESPSDGNPRFGDVDWSDVIGDSNMGVLYAHIEELWDDCLWNDYRLTVTEAGNVFMPENLIWQYRSVASRCRLDSHATHFLMMAAAAVKRSNGFVSGRLPEVISLVKEGRKQRIRLGSLSEPSNHLIGAIAMRMYAQEPYYAELLTEPQERLSGATLNSVLGAWAILSRTASIMSESVERHEIPKNASEGQWLPLHAPTLQTSVLATAIRDGCGISLDQARQLVEFFIYRGKADEEMWAQPLVPVSSTSVVPFFAATSAPNLRRLVDVWMRQLGVDLGLRGPAFEQHVRDEIALYIKSSPLLMNATCVNHGVNFCPAIRKEQIDVVFVIGDLVVIGEAKCMLQPVEAKQIAVHRDKVIDAAAQVKRKAKAVEANPETFRQTMEECGLTLPMKFHVLPMVILNSASHAAFAVDEVPVVDLLVLSVFFEGELREMALQEPDGVVHTIKKRVLYSSAEEGANVAETYFSAPPQMEVFLAGMEKRIVPVARIGEDDWVGAYVTFDCVIKAPISDGAFEKETSQ